MAEICVKGHDSLRRANRNCIQCEKERYQTDPAYKEKVKMRAKAKRDRVKAEPELKATQAEYMIAYRKKNAEALNKQQSERYFADPKHRIKTRLRRLKMKSSDKLIAQILSHAGYCDICNKPGDGRWNELSIDHCHVTGNFRGMLCSSCNRGIGLMQDDPSLLRKAVEYLQPIQNRKTVPGESMPG